MLGCYSSLGTRADEGIDPLQLRATHHEATGGWSTAAEVLNLPKHQIPADSKAGLQNPQVRAICCLESDKLSLETWETGQQGKRGWIEPSDAARLRNSGGMPTDHSGQENFRRDTVGLDSTSVTDNNSKGVPPLPSTLVNSCNKDGDSLSAMGCGDVDPHVPLQEHDNSLAGPAIGHILMADVQEPSAGHVENYSATCCGVGPRAPALCQGNSSEETDNVVNNGGETKADCSATAATDTLIRPMPTCNQLSSSDCGDVVPTPIAAGEVSCGRRGADPSMGLQAGALVADEEGPLTMQVSSCDQESVSRKGGFGDIAAP